MSALRYLLYLATLAGGVLLGLLAVRDPGYVLIRHGDWQLEMALSFLLLGMGLAFALLYGLLRLAALGLAGLRWLRGARQRQLARRADAARQALARGIYAWAGGDAGAAQRLFAQHAAAAEQPALHHLTAATAAHAQGEMEAAAQHLQHAAAAAQNHPAAAQTIVRVQARWERTAGRAEAALALLEPRYAAGERDAALLRELALAQAALGRYDAVTPLLPQLEKQHALADGALRRLGIAAYAGLLQEAVDAAALEQRWKQIPAHRQTAAELTVDYARRLAELGEAAGAARLLGERLKRQWDSTLAAAYARLPVPDALKHLTDAEALLKGHEQDPLLLQALGEAALRNRLWGKARAYLEASLARAPALATVRLLAELLERLGEREAALARYRQGLLLALGQPVVPTLPAIVPAAPGPGFNPAAGAAGARGSGPGTAGELEEMADATAPVPLLARS